MYMYIYIWWKYTEGRPCRQTLKFDTPVLFLRDKSMVFFFLGSYRKPDNWQN